MQTGFRTTWQVAIVATVIFVSSGAVSAKPGHGYGYGEYSGPVRGYYAPHRAFRSYRPYRRYGYRRPYRAYGRYAPLAYNAYSHRVQGAYPRYAYGAKPLTQGADDSELTKAQAPKKTAAGDGNARVQIANMSFSPAKITVKAGETVTGAQLTGMPHTVTTNDGSLDSPTLGQNRRFSVTFDEPGTYSLRLQTPSIHAGRS